MWYKAPHWDSLKATLFGKFYETIVANYFSTKGFNVYDQGIAIYIEWLEELNEHTLGKKIEKLHNIKLTDPTIIDKVIKKFQDEIMKLKERRRQRFHPDLVLEKGCKYYIVEMQVWPVWLKQKYRETGLTWNVILNEGVAIVPRILATKVKVQNKVHPVSGFYYVTYSRSKDHESIEEFFKLFTSREFKLLYMDEIIQEVKDRKWYKELLSRVKDEVTKLLKNLEEGKVEL